MLKKVATLSIFALFVLFLPLTAFAWDDCPFGLVDDPYPGECSRYVDTDNDGLCDHSQLAPEDRVEADTNGDSAGEKSVINESEPEEEHDDDNKAKLLTSVATVILFLVSIVGYVQYRKKYD